MSLLTSLCLFFLKAGALSFGGGYAVLYLLQSEIVYRNHWITPGDFADVVAIAEMTPGPIAVNASTFVGYRLLGPLAGILTTLCIVAIPFLLALLASMCYQKLKDNKNMQYALKGIRPAVVGLIAAAGLGIADVSFPDSISVGIFLFAAWLLFKWRVNPITVMLLSGGAGIVLYAVVL